MNIQEHIVVIPWYREGLGAQEPIHLEFLCTIRPLANSARFMIDAVDFIGLDPFRMAGFGRHKMKLRNKIRVELAKIYEVDLRQIGNIESAVMWYNDGKSREPDDVVLYGI